jgi:hypothetical protein
MSPKKMSTNNVTNYVIIVVLRDVLSYIRQLNLFEANKKLLI